MKLCYFGVVAGVLAACGDNVKGNSAADAGADAPLGDAPGAPAVIHSFTASPAVIPANETLPQTITLTWSVDDATTLSIDGIGTVTGSGTTTTITAATTFTLTASNTDSIAATATASVAADTAGALGIYVDPVNGSDGNPGTPSQPVQTIPAATSLVQHGSLKTVFMAGGTYIDFSNISTDVPDGTVMEPLAASITFDGSGLGRGLDFDGSASLSGVAFAHFGEAVLVDDFNVGGGKTVSLSAVTFTGCATPLVIEDGALVLSAGGVTDYVTDSATQFATVDTNGQLEIDGGTIEHVTSHAFVIDGDLLKLDGVKVENAPGDFVDNFAGELDLVDGTVIDHSGGVFLAGGTVLVDHSTISNATGDCINASTSGGTITVQNNSVLSGCTGRGILAEGTVTVADSTIEDNTDEGIRIDPGAVTITGSTITGNSDGVAVGLRGACQVSMRNSTVTNQTAGVFGTQISEATTIDLGSDGDLGGNTIAGNTTNLSLTVNVESQNVTFTAVGNTWDPNADGADGSGHFAAGTVLQAGESGKNVALTNLENMAFALDLDVGQ